MEDAMGLLERLDAAPIICAEGYLFELERRGYVQAGPFVPEVVLEAPEAVAALHREFVRAGSDVVEAFTYYGHREKLRAVGREDDIEQLNRTALAIAAEVARESDALLAGNISNTHLFEPDDPATHVRAQAMFEEQVGWAAQAGVDFVIAETFPFSEEALLAVREVTAAGLACVATLAIFKDPVTFDGVPVAEACRRLADAGADVVGLNCMRGPKTMLPLLGPIVAAVDVPVAALPVPYRTTKATPAFVSLCDAGYPSPPGGRAFPTALDPLLCNRYEIADFTASAAALGVRYLGLCCGAGPHHIRAMAEALGRTPPASRYSPDMAGHALFGDSDGAASARTRHEQRL
jgi:betaine-homocysteine S-methyltransferase